MILPHVGSIEFLSGQERVSLNTHGLAPHTDLGRLTLATSAVCCLGVLQALAGVAFRQRLAAPSLILPRRADIEKVARPGRIYLPKAVLGVRPWALSDTRQES